MISVPSRSTTGRSAGEVQRHDRNVLGVDVLPDVELGPVRQREDAHALARLCACCRGATARAAGSSGSQRCWPCETRRRAPWRGSSPRRAARRRRRHRSRTASSACFSAWVFMTSVCTASRESNGLMPRAQPSAIDVHEELQPSRLRRGVAERDHLAEFQVVSTCSSGNGGGAGKKAFMRQVQHDPRVLADRIEHHRALRPRPRPRGECECSRPRGACRGLSAVTRPF